MKKKKKFIVSEEMFFIIHDEGFDYTFSAYSAWRDIKDPEFHKLRKEYLAAKKKLAKFLKVDPQTVF